MQPLCHGPKVVTRPQQEGLPRIALLHPQRRHYDTEAPLTLHQAAVTVALEAGVAAGAAGCALGIASSIRELRLWFWQYMW